MTIIRTGAGAVMSQAVVSSGTVYLAGQVAMDKRSKPLTAQAASIFAQIDSLLGSVGSDRSRLLSATIYLVNIGDFAEFNDSWVEWLGTGPMPARTTIGGIDLALSGLLIEVTVIAALAT
jgi:enamine deaminase RidA (YjgF/YER057c/UK114 family)